MKTAIPLLVLLFSFFALSGCGDKSSSKPKPNKKLYLSLEEEEHLFYLQNPFDKKREVIISNKEGEKIRLVAYNCSVIKAVVKEGIVVKWVNIFRPSLVYLFSKCSRSTITLTKDNYVEVFLGKTGFGGGGCCAVSGTFRTKDGENWEEKIKGKWKKYEERK